MARPTRFRTVLAALAAGPLAMFGTAAVGAVGDPIDSAALQTLAGSYLAARSAYFARDIDAAETFFSQALLSDPDNPVLIDRLLPLRLAKGEMDSAFPLARQMATFAGDHPVARLALAVEAVKQGKSDSALSHFDSIPADPLATLTGGLISAWLEFDMGKPDEAVARIDALSGPEWYAIFKDYHTALILDAAGRTSEAADVITEAYEADDSALRFVEAYAVILARAGRADEALDALGAFRATAPVYPLIDDLAAIIESGEMPEPVAADAEDGAAEVLYGLGSAMGAEQGIEQPVMYLQLSRYLDARDHLPIMAVGDLQQIAGLCENAIAAYDAVPMETALRRNADIQIGNCLAVLDRYEEAAAHLRRIVEVDPSDYEAAVELGNVYRANEQFADATNAYDLAIEAIGDPSKVHWRLHYFRGITLERSKRWDEAEADFKRALEIEPEQPLVLNYLGYSWVDMGINLEPALEMIRRAVDLRPSDGYVVDSLGWAYYRLGRHEEAVKELEQAVELRPEDPVINDHLGDAYWKVGRKREAMFQWSHARDLEPEPDELPKILQKLEHGLPNEAAAEQAVEPEGSAAEPQQPTALAAVDATAPAVRTVQVKEGESLSAIAERIFGNADAYTLILEANRDSITDPNLIYPGMTLKIPAAEAN